MITARSFELVRSRRLAAAEAIPSVCACVFSLLALAETGRLFGLLGVFVQYGIGKMSQMFLLMKFPEAFVRKVCTAFR
jgi:hypothetical protein